MRLCIPTKTNEGYAARVFPHFSHAPYFTVYDTKLKYLSIIKNKYQHQKHGEGSPRQLIQEHRIEAVICVDISVKVLKALNHAKIKVYKTQDKDVNAALKDFDANTLEEWTLDQAQNQEDLSE